MKEKQERYRGMNRRAEKTTSTRRHYNNYSKMQESK